MTERQGRQYQQLLYDRNERREFYKLDGEALYRAFGELVLKEDMDMS
jgi:hypothetical protein